jgi:predicted amidophosphoribosyltransferase
MADPIQSIPDSNPDAELAGRCPFCAHPTAAEATVCPECGRQVDQGLAFSVRKPLWVRILVYLTLAAMLVGGFFWVADLLQHAFR